MIYLFIFFSTIRTPTIDDLQPPNEKVDKAKNILKMYEEERKIQEAAKTNPATVEAEV